MKFLQCLYFNMKEYQTIEKKGRRLEVDEMGKHRLTDVG